MKLLLSEKKELEADKKEINLEYYITVDEFKGVNEAEMESYGICIKQGVEEVSFHGITSRMKTIEWLMERLTENSVTLTTLPDVIDDLLDDCFL